MIFINLIDIEEYLVTETIKLPDFMYKIFFKNIYHSIIFCEA